MREKVGEAYVRVNAGERRSAGSLDVREERCALVLFAAVSAAPVEFAEGLDAVGVDLHCSWFEVISGNARQRNRERDAYHRRCVERPCLWRSWHHRR